MAEWSKAPDCNSVEVSLRWFESNLPYRFGALTGVVHILTDEIGQQDGAMEARRVHSPSMVVRLHLLLRS